MYKWSELSKFVKIVKNWSKISNNVMLCSEIKITQSVSDWVTRSPIELCGQLKTCLSNYRLRLFLTTMVMTTMWGKVFGHGDRPASSSPNVNINSFRSIQVLIIVTSLPGIAASANPLQPHWRTHKRIKQCLPHPLKWWDDLIVKGMIWESEQT